MSNKWFYAQEDLQHGPISEEELYQRFLERNLSLTTLVWCKGMGDWEPADLVTPFCEVEDIPPPVPKNTPRKSDSTPPLPEPNNNFDLKMPPPLPKTRSILPKFLVEQNTVEFCNVGVLDHKSLDTELRPWSRYWARNLDHSIYLILGTVFSIGMAMLLGENYASYTVSLTIWTALFLGGWIFIESSLISSIGTTPGKWLFKVKIKNPDGSNLSFKQALRRTLKVWCGGEGLGIPLVSLSRNMTSYNKLASTGITSWDENGKYQVSTEQLGVGRAILCVFLIIAFSTLLQVITSLGSSLARMGQQ